MNIAGLPVGRQVTHHCHWAHILCYIREQGKHNATVMCRGIRCVGNDWAVVGLACAAFLLFFKNVSIT